MSLIKKDKDRPATLEHRRINMECGLCGFDGRVEINHEGYCEGGWHCPGCGKPLESEGDDTLVL